MTQSNQQLYLDTPNRDEELLQINIDTLDSPVISRLIEEIRNDNESTVYSYDRVHNRHNR